MPFAPTDIADCTLWLKSNTGITADANNRVSAWASGVGSISFAQSTDANKPLLSRSDNQENQISYSSALDTTGSWGDSARVNLTFPSSDVMQAAATNVAGTHTIFRYNTPWNLPVIAGRAYVMDFSLKANGVRYVQVQTNTDFGINIKLDLLTGTVSSGTATVTADGDYWRVSVPFTAATSANNPALIYLTGDSNYTLSWTGDNAAGVFMKKPQLRAAAADSTYLANTLATPQYRGINGLPTLVMNLSSAMTSTTTLASIISASADTAFGAYVIDAFPASGVILNDISGQRPLLGVTTGKLNTSAFVGGSKVAELAATVGTHIGIGRHEGGNLYFQLDGASSAPTACGNVATLTGAMIIGYAGSSWNGRILELITFNRALTAAERQQVTDYLGNQWGVDGLQGSTILMVGVGSI